MMYDDDHDDAWWWGRCLWISSHERKYRCMVPFAHVKIMLETKTWFKIKATMAFVIVLPWELPSSVSLFKTHVCLHVHLVLCVFICCVQSGHHNLTAVSKCYCRLLSEHTEPQDTAEMARGGVRGGWSVEDGFLFTVLKRPHNNVRTCVKSEK